MSAWKRSVVLNAEIVSLNQDALLAPGARVALDDARGTQVWAKRLAGGDVAVLLINTGAAAQAVAVAWPALGWPAAANASVRDLWAHAELGYAVGGWTAAAVAPHGNALLRLTRVAG
jgi:alpha-galactosidase